MAPLPITVSALALDPPAGPWPIEQPIELKLAAPVFDDGAAVTDAESRKLGAFVLRVDGGGERVWDEKAKAWVAVPADAAGWEALDPVPLSYAADRDPPWQGSLVASGMKDGSGADRFAVAAGGGPAYRLRPFVLAEHGGRRYRGLGAPSADIAFTTIADKQRFTIAMEPKSPQDCERARFVLKNGALADAGWFEIRSTSGRQEVEIVKCDAGGAAVASVLLADDGNIVLRPGGGGRIVIDGELEARRFTRLQADGSRLDVT